MSATQPPPPDTTNVIPGLVGISFLFAAAVGTLGVRIWTQIRPTFKLTLVDYIVSAAFLCELLVLICLFSAIRLGLGHYEYYISESTLIEMSKYFFPLGIFGFWASSLARLSIALMLLRLEISKIWRVVLWILAFIQVGMPIAADIFQLLQCHPIRAMWEPVSYAVCWSASKSQSFGYIYSVMGVINDLIFGVMPIYFISSLKRPVIERALVCLLMVFGIIAAVAGVMKVYYIQYWNPRQEEVTLRDSVPLFWWYRVEEIGLIVASCVPFLKVPIERLLYRLGIFKPGFGTTEMETSQPGEGETEKDVTKTVSTACEEV